MNLFTCDCCGSRARDQHKVTGGVVCSDCINDAQAMLTLSEKRRLRLPRICPVCQDADCETKSFRCGE